MASSVSGPKLDNLKQTLIEWYAQKRIELIEAFEEDHPYGSVRLSKMEQYAQFEAKLQDPNNWIMLVASLYERYRGLPDASERVQKDLEDYIRSMRALGAELRAVQNV